MKTQTGIEIINQRPAGMPYSVYRQKRIAMRDRLKEYSKGRFAYISSYIHKNEETGITYKHSTRQPFRGSVRQLKVA